MLILEYGVDQGIVEGGAKAESVVLSVVRLSLLCQPRIGGEVLFKLDERQSILVG